jgi:hypothetical protein
MTEQEMQIRRFVERFKKNAKKILILLFVVIV